MYGRCKEGGNVVRKREFVDEKIISVLGNGVF